ncbi:hypothetical protein PINS_up001053 [Pythium insidiosum]|nr:hypothetical protein PINS_up001053 [Pythium insidiosum]
MALDCRWIWICIWIGASAVAAVAVASPWTSDRFVTTRLRMVRGASREEAMESCQRNGRSVTVGIDWEDGLSLCQHRQNVDDIAPTDLVVQSIAVLAGSVVCPDGSTLLHTPRNRVLVCVAMAMAGDVLPAGNYVSDVAVTSERNYNNDADDLPGWTTAPINLHAMLGFWRWLVSPPNRGVFLSVRRPVWPITGLHRLAGVRRAQVSTACASRLGWQWGSAGLGTLDEDDANDSRSVLFSG